jgi:hypothetical protein
MGFFHANRLTELVSKEYAEYFKRDLTDNRTHKQALQHTKDVSITFIDECNKNSYKHNVITDLALSRKHLQEYASLKLEEGTAMTERPEGSTVWTWKEYEDKVLDEIPNTPAYTTAPNNDSA